MADKLDGSAIVANTIPGTKIQSGTITTSQLDPSIAQIVNSPIHPKISSLDYPGDDTAANTGGGDTVIIRGSGFKNNVAVYINGNAVPSVTYNNANAVTITTAAQSSGSYLVYLINTDDGGTAILVPGIQYSGLPTWVTESPLDSQTATSTWDISLSATSDSAVSYELQAGSSLPAGITLSANGLISGTLSSPPADDTTYNFTVVAIDAELQDTPKAFSVSVTVAVDTKFQYTTLLLQADGTEGGNNHAFVDSSDNAFTITRNGNASQGSFSPFSPTGWSGYFDGTGDRITFTKQTTTSSFTCECWFYGTGEPTGGYHILFGGSSTSAGPDNIQLTARNDGQLVLVLNSTVVAQSATGLFTINQWHHIAFVRSGTSCAIFMDGLRVATGTSSAALNVDRIGGQFSTYEPIGYISNARITTTAVYDPSLTTCTVPTAPLTAVEGTYLLALQDNRIIDRSASPLTLTPAGNVSIQAFSPYATTTAYSPTTHGGSAYFDGTGDYLSGIGAVSDFNFMHNSSALFTFECWVYINSLASINTLIDNTNGTSNQIGIHIYVDTSGVIFVAITRGVTSSFVLAGAQSTGTVSINSWNHIAVTYDQSLGSDNCKFYINGVAAGTGTKTANAPSASNASNAMRIGAYASGSGPFLGYISNLRITNSIVYSEAFTPPTSILTNIANTALLCSFSNANIYDSAAGSVLETVGDAKVNTSITKFGAGSMAFDGNGDNLTIQDNELIRLASGDFTIEAWVYPTANGALYDSGFVSYGAASTLAGWFFGMSGTNTGGTLNRLIWSVNYAVSGGAPVYAVTGVPLNTWSHVAVSKVGSTILLFLNGNLDKSNTVTATPTTSSSYKLYLGAASYDPTGTQRSLTGYMDDVRITKGYARYRYNFTPPTKAFAARGGTETLTADPYFPYTTLLLPGNGTNNQNNHTFLDSSDNSFTITRNGNATQGTFSPFSQTGWSNYFDGNGDQLSSNTAAISSVGSNDFCFEGWFYFFKNTNTYAQGLISYGVAGDTSGTSYISFQCNSSGYPAVAYATGGSLTLTSSVLPPLNQWSHLVLCRTGSNLSIFLNGVRTGTTTTSATVGSGGNALTIGGQWYANASTRQFQGYISNVRIVRGSSPYNAGSTSFTVPTSPLTAIANTSLLTCQSNRFIDSSNNAYSITRAGDVSVQAFSPFAPTASYSAATYGGSGYFDGTGDYLTAPANSAYELIGDFTIELWVKTAASDLNTYYRRLLCFGQDAANNPQLVFFNGSAATTNLCVYSNSILITGSIAVATNEWNHVALCRSGTSLKLFVNGVQSGSTATTSQNFNAGASNGVYIGRYALDGGYLSGYMSGLRILKGTALYTTAFTPPTAPLTNVANTSLLLNFTNAGITDATAKNVLETVGDAKISTVQSKFGGSSMYFDGSGDWLISTASPNLALGSGDFTIEAWVRRSTPGSGAGVILQMSSGTDSYSLLFGYISGSNYVVYISSNGSSWDIASAQLLGPIQNDVWVHYALTRYGSTFKTFKDGIQQATWTSSSSVYQASNQVTVGRAQGTHNYVGYMQDLRITKGIARYTQNFTLDLPTSAFLTK